MKKVITISILLLIFLVVKAQTTVVGKITDKKGNPMSLVLIEVKGIQTNRVLTDDKGIYSIKANIGDFLEISSSDGKSQLVKITKNQCNVTLDAKTDVIEKGYNFQTTKKASTMSSAAAGYEKMEKFSSLNPENALYGLIPGLSVQTNGGMIYANNPTIRLRGVGTLNNSSALVLIDGVERSLDRLSVNEIENVTVLKDAAALAIYGIRGANGVILVTTKRGEFGKMKVDVKYQHGLTTPFRLPKMVDAPTYALALNEALTNDGLAPKYTSGEIEMFRDGSNPDMYPNVNWLEEATRPSGNTNELNMSFSGGTENMRYFTNVNYANDFGLLKPIPSEEGYNTALNYYKLNIRTNLDIKLTRTTRMKVNVMGSIDDYTRPNVGPNTVFQRTVSLPAAAFPVKTTSDHWGGNLIYTTQNPVAGIASSGFVRGQNRILFADMNLEQNLSGFVPGLTAEAGLSFDNMADYIDTQSRTFQYETDSVLYGNNSDLNFTSTLNDMYMNSSMYAKLNHLTETGNSRVNSFLLYTFEEAQRKTRNNKVARQSIIAGVNYSLSDRYFFDLVGSYSGSSYLSKGDKFHFYPAASAAWIISDEDFMKQVSGIDMLKLRASYGASGNDRLSYELDRQFYVGGTSYYFTNSNTTAAAIKEGQLATADLKAELAVKANVGIDLMLLKGLDFSFDAFQETRSNILVPNSAVTSSVLGVTPSEINMGVVENKGFEAALTYSAEIGDFKYGVTAQYAFVKNKIIERNEGYKPYDYLYRTGNPIGTYYGLEAIGFFSDAADIANSYPQMFSVVSPGDIKYKDQNGDEIIDSYDVVKLGNSTLYPEVYYSFTVNAEYKGLGFEALFQGIENFQVSRTSADLYWPMQNNGNISEWYYNGGRWTPENKDNAKLPRLTTLDNANNFRNNSLWLQDGSYLKLRYLDIYYHLPIKKNNVLSSAKVFVRGMNLFSLDHINDKDPEVMNTSYPSLSSYHFGCTVSF
ncbi:MAG: SusC/RagA family TonB-linked outer membrane protein [Bacteroidales bacterium]